VLALLIDGPADGKVLQVRDDLWDLVMPVPPNLPRYAWPSPLETLGTQRALYHRHPSLEAQPPGIVTLYLYAPPIHPNR